ncbi:15-hydroxyprostaglandin dehydrogenase [Rhizodiscina lignyota]|uniref:15-hydroxyprostaglandin dehydrogenase n=1 Tax=Rhizodiscina lignyota TaxID=1504668 RepID=A0A9P4I5F8_9PEZI|nr:15-hydroxyprostaglandin dehydrogenase [Rhizodiscina lignyota]
MSGRIAIVTGASSGMGEALSRHLVSKGWKVGMADIQANEKLSKELGDSAAFFQTNVADYDSQAKTFQAVFDKWGRIDALCANAGIVDKSSIYILGHRNSDTIPPKPNLLCTDVDYKGVVYGTQLAIHFMRKNKTPGGKIVATVSAAALYPHETYPEYDGAKAAVLNFIHATGRVLHIKDNVDINGVLPGIVHTSIIPQAMVDAVSAEAMTPVSNIISAYEKLLNDTTGIHGQGLECQAKEQYWVKFPEYAGGKISQRSCTVWDPLFKMYHGEDSDLPDAIKTGTQDVKF